MKNFAYYRPKTAEEAIGLLNQTTWGKTELLAGGTDLLDLQKEYIAQPDKVISLNGLADGFTAITGKVVFRGGQSHQFFSIGAGAKLAEIAEHAGLRKEFPSLTVPAGMIGGPQIRNMGTLGGNLCQRNRCWYFRDEHVNCLLKGGDKCFALHGDNRYHAVFTKGHPCVIVHPSTLAPALIALGATATVQGPKGNRKIKMSEFFLAPQDATQREHVLAPDELVLSVEIEAHPQSKNASYEVRHKQSHDWPLVQAVVAYRDEGGKAKDVKVVLGHVAPTPLAAEAAAQALEGRAVTEESAAAAGNAATEGVKPLARNEYKVKLIEVAVKRAALLAAGKKPYWEA